MPRARLSFGTACTLSAAVLIVGCATSPQSSPNPDTKVAEAVIPGVPVSRANKTDLMGCWTHEGRQDVHAANLVETIYGVEGPYGTTTVCFGKQGRFIHSTLYQREILRDVSAKYTLLRDGRVRLTERDFIWGSDQIELRFAAKDQLRMVVFLPEEERKLTYLFHRDTVDIESLDVKSGR